MSYEMDFSPAVVTARSRSRRGRPRVLPTGLSDEPPMQAGGFRNGDVGDEEEPDNAGLGEVRASLPDPGEGMVYMLRREDDGSIAVVCVPDDGADLNQNDSGRGRHSLSDAAAIKWNRRLNGINRRRWSRTRDAEGSYGTTLFRHKHLAPGERLELQGPDEHGGYDLVLFSPTKDLTGDPLPGTATKAKESSPGTLKGPQAWAVSAGRAEEDIKDIIQPVKTGDSRGLTEPQRLHLMNKAAAAFWSRRAA